MLPPVSGDGSRPGPGFCPTLKPAIASGALLTGSREFSGATAGVITGAGITTAAVGDLLQHAAGDDQVSPVNTNSGESSGTVGKSGTKTDRLKEHLTEKDLDAARRELNGEVVATKPNGQPWDHVDEVRNAQRGLVNRVNQLKRQLGDSRISDADRGALQSELSEASRLLDHSEQYVTRN